MTRLASLVIGAGVILCSLATQAQAQEIDVASSASRWRPTPPRRPEATENWALAWFRT